MRDNFIIVVHQAVLAALVLALQMAVPTGSAYADNSEQLTQSCMALNKSEQADADCSWVVACLTDDPAKIMGLCRMLYERGRKEGVIKSGSTYAEYKNATSWNQAPSASEADLNRNSDASSMSATRASNGQGDRLSGPVWQSGATEGPSMRSDDRPAGSKERGVWVRAGSGTPVSVGLQTVPGLCIQTWKCTTPGGDLPIWVTPSQSTKGSCSASDGPPNSCNACIAWQPQEPCEWRPPH
jgi:hypothetical protein